jgi:outer membrane protein, heavy metal efflux system
VIRPAGINRLAAIGATTAVLWLDPAAAGDQTLPGATVESVVAIAKRLNPTVAAASLDFDAAVHKIGTAGVLADPVDLLKLKLELQTKYAEMERLAGGSL